jgi:hypothetical protein
VRKSLNKQVSQPSDPNGTKASRELGLANSLKEVTKSLPEDFSIDQQAIGRLVQDYKKARREKREGTQELSALFDKRSRHPRSAYVGFARQPAILRQLGDLWGHDHGAFVPFAPSSRKWQQFLSASSIRHSQRLAPRAVNSGCYSRPDQATALVRVAIESGAELVRDIAGEGFVTVMVGGHRETWPVRSKALSSSI